jgi:hypothetical protein
MIGEKSYNRLRRKHRILSELSTADWQSRGTALAGVSLSPALVKEGETGIFTPMFYFHVRNPTGS